MKKCNCSHLEIIRDKDMKILRLQCRSCSKTWHYNNLLGYWSDSFVGTFKEIKSKRSKRNGK